MCVRAGLCLLAYLSVHARLLLQAGLCACLCAGWRSVPACVPAFACGRVPVPARSGDAGALSWLTNLVEGSEVDRRFALGWRCPCGHDFDTLCPGISALTFSIQQLNEKCTLFFTSSRPKRHPKQHRGMGLDALTMGSAYRAPQEKG